MATLQTKPNRGIEPPRPARQSGGGSVAPKGLQGATWKWATGIIMAYVCYGAFYIATGNVNFGASDNSARIVFFHVPCAILSYVAYVVGFVYGLKHLLKKKAGGALLDDRKSAAAMELGFLFCTLATVSGSIFAGMVWGSFWNWDPRETSIVIMLLLYASYLVLRSALANSPNQRAQLCAVYAILALVPATFLIWVVPRVMTSNHPTQTLQNPANTSLEYKLVLYPSFLAFTLLFVWLFQLRCRLQAARERRALSGR